MITLTRCHVAALHHAHYIGCDVDGREDRPREGQISGPGTKQNTHTLVLPFVFNPNDRCMITLQRQAQDKDRDICTFKW